VSLAVAAASQAAAVVLTGLLGLAGTLVVVTSRPSRQWRAEPREAHWLGALRSPGLAVLLCACFFVGTALGSIALAAVVYGDGHGGGPVAAWVLAANGAGALAGGLLYGARHWAGAPEPRLRALSVILAAAYLPLPFAPGTVCMALLAALAGFFLAPALACTFLVVDRHAPAGTVTEAFSWVVTAVGVGSALGTAAAGLAAQHGGIRAAFAVPPAGGAVAAAVLLATCRILATPNLAGRPEKDRNGTDEPRFSPTQRA
jgi:predicted MFS family arabinose efflux permease